VDEDEIEDGRGRPFLPHEAEMAALARVVLRSRRSAALATALATDGGRPYASLVTFACDVDGSPILLLSNLAEHTRNLRAEARASLLIEHASRRANPQTGPRLTLLGRIEARDDERLRTRFLARHPGAALYAGFADIRVYLMTVERAHYIGGFGGGHWIAADALLTDAEAARAIAEAEPSAIEHMNTDHAQSIDLYASRLLGRAGSGWRIVALDPDGCDLARGNALARLTFPRPARDAGELRAMLVELAGAARDASEPGRKGAG
jgi:putative heme iron utilization protein